MGTFTRESKSGKSISLKDYMTHCANFNPITLNVINYSDEKWIKDAIEAITHNEPIIKENNQCDSPVSTNTLLIYEDNQKYFVEIPYQGVYEIEKEFYERLMNFKEQNKA